MKASIYICNTVKFLHVDMCIPERQINSPAVLLSAAIRCVQERQHVFRLSSPLCFCSPRAFLDTLPAMPPSEERSMTMLRHLLTGCLVVLSFSFGCGAARDGRGGWVRTPMAVGALSGLRFIHVRT